MLTQWVLNVKNIFLRIFCDGFAIILAHLLKKSAKTFLKKAKAPSPNYILNVENPL